MNIVAMAKEKLTGRGGYWDYRLTDCLGWGQGSTQ